MRVLFVAPRYHTNQVFVVRALLRNGHDVAFHVVYEGASEEHRDLRPEVVPPSRLYRALARLLGKERDRDFAMRFMLPSLRRYVRRFREFDPDVVIVRNPNHLPSLVATVVARASRSGIVLYTQGPKHSRASWQKRILLQFVLWFTRGQWITPVQGKPGARTWTDDRIHYLPFPTEVPAGPKREWRVGDTTNLLTIGKFQPRKNHVLVLRALAALRERHPSLRLTIVGERTSESHEHEYRRVRSFIDRNGLRDRVRVRSNVSFDEVQEEMRRHDLYILASRDEPAAVSILEAMANGLPVVSSRGNGTHGYVRDGENGAVFATDDLRGLVAAIEDVVADERRMRRMGERSRELAATVHDPDRYHEKLMQVASRAVGGRSGRLRATVRS